MPHGPRRNLGLIPCAQLQCSGAFDSRVILLAISPSAKLGWRPNGGRRCDAATNSAKLVHMMHMCCGYRAPELVAPVLLRTRLARATRARTAPVFQRVIMSMEMPSENRTISVFYFAFWSTEYSVLVRRCSSMPGAGSAPFVPLWNGVRSPDSGLCWVDPGHPRLERLRWTGCLLLLMRRPWRMESRAGPRLRAISARRS